MKKGLAILLASCLVFLLIPSALAGIHSRGGWDLFQIQNITEEQEEALVTLMIKHRLAAMENQKGLHKLQEEYMALKREWQADPAQVEEILTEMGEIKNQIFQEMQEKRQHLEEIFTEEQLAEYKELWEEQESFSRTKSHGRRHGSRRF